MGKRYQETSSKARERIKPLKKLIGYLDEIGKEDPDRLKASKNVHEDYAMLEKFTSNLPVKIEELQKLLIDRKEDAFKKFDEDYQIFAAPF